MIVAPNLALSGLLFLTQESSEWRVGGFELKIWVLLEGKHFMCSAYLFKLLQMCATPFK